MTIHVSADDVHLLRMRRADFGAIDLFALARLGRLGIQRAQFFVGLQLRVGIDARRAAHSAISGRRLSRIRRNRRAAGPPRFARANTGI